MNILLEIYLISGILVGFFEGLFLEKNAKRLLKDRKMQSMQSATQSVMFGVIFIAITPIINTLHLIVKTLGIFVRVKIK